MFPRNPQEETGKVLAESCSKDLAPSITGMQKTEADLQATVNNLMVTQD
jgi:hypothetical protein